MGMFLDSIIPFNSYQTTASGTYFVDKSSLLEELMPAVGTEERFFCITRPRRFGKSVMANMIAAFFGKKDKVADVQNDLALMFAGEAIPSDIQEYAATAQRKRMRMRSSLN